MFFYNQSFLFFLNPPLEKKKGFLSFSRIYGYTIIASAFGVVSSDLSCIAISLTCFSQYNAMISDLSESNIILKCLQRPVQVLSSL